LRDETKRINKKRILAEFWRITGRNTEFPDGLAALLFVPPRTGENNVPVSDWLKNKYLPISFPS
jgi:hypothetical protein